MPLLEDTFVFPIALPMLAKARPKLKKRVAPRRRGTPQDRPLASEPYHQGFVCGEVLERTPVQDRLPQSLFSRDAKVSNIAS